MPGPTTERTPKAPAIRYDDRGHAIPPTDDERRERSEALRRGLAEMASIPDDPPGSDEEFWRAIDADRPERPLFGRFLKP